MPSIDLRKTQKALYTPPHGKIQVVEIPTMQYLAIDGQGDPNTSPAYTDAVSALYTLAYGIKAERKRDGAVDHTVLPLEGFWWMADGHPFSFIERSGWRWTMLIRQPDDTTATQFSAAVTQATKKKKLDSLATVRLETITEGLVAQTLHYGPYADEAPTIDLLHAAITAQGHQARDKHHEIYLTDPRRSAPEKMRTILRQPIR